MFSWCRDENNLEAAYISAEYSLLLAWDSAKKFPRKTTATRAFENLLKTYHTISDAYLEKSIFPFVSIPVDADETAVEPEKTP